NTSVSLNNTLTMKTAMFRPAVFTALDDTSLGDPLSIAVDSTYTGDPNNYPGGYANPALSFSMASYTINNCRFCYAQTAVKFNNSLAVTLTVNHAQFWKCARGIWLAYSGSGCGTCAATISVNNCLMGKVTYPLTLP